MKLQDLKNNLCIRWVGRCNYYVTMNYRGQVYDCHSNKSLAWDRLTEDENGMLNEHQWSVGNLTLKQAYQSFYEECKMANGL